MSLIDIVGHTSTALQVVWKIAVKLKNSREEIALVEKAMRGVIDELKLLKARMQKSNSPLSKSSANM